MRRALIVVAAFLTGFAACAKEQGADSGSTDTGSESGAGAMASATVAGSGGAEPDAGKGGEGGGLVLDLDAGGDANLDENQVCAAVAQKAETKQLPVDIIWMVDNSSSMAPAVQEVKAGLNAFASTIAMKNLDYHVIMLSLRDPQSPITFNGGTRYPVCIAPPLSGDNNCGDGPTFFQSSIDIFSTQTLEQFLGTLAQTDGYLENQKVSNLIKGGPPWKQHLRAGATKTIVVVTDDDTRLSVTDFETFPGGKNPFNSLTLPPGILDPSWMDLFKGYVFSGIYGWGSDVDPGVKCQYPDMTNPPSSGPNYTVMVNKTGGVRAKICDGQAAWLPFFDAVAQAVIQTSKLACNMVIPEPQTGIIDYGKINVEIVTGGGMNEQLGKVDDASKCGVGGGWYYNDNAMPTEVILCPASCDAANASVGQGKPGEIQILFGCETILK